MRAHSSAIGSFSFRRAPFSGVVRCAHWAVLFVWLAGSPAPAQELRTNPPDYRGVFVHMDGVFVTPFPNAPFTALVKLESTEVLHDGSSMNRMTVNNIARDTRGRIYNERRSFGPGQELISAHIFDPDTKLSTFLNPFTNIARQRVFQGPPTPEAAKATKESVVQEESLGENIMENLPVHGTRKTTTIPAKSSGTGMPVTVTDEYWFSQDLRMNMLVKHSDPRSGTQTVTITKINRADPDPAIFEIPANYKIVDVNPN